MTLEVSHEVTNRGCFSRGGDGVGAGRAGAGGGGMGMAYRGYIKAGFPPVMLTEL